MKGILIKAAEQGYITELACKMPECFCPEELGGARYFEPVKEMSDWSPTHGHFPLSKGGQSAMATRRSRRALAAGRAMIAETIRMNQNQRSTVRAPASSIAAGEH